MQVLANSRLFVRCAFLALLMLCALFFGALNAHADFIPPDELTLNRPVIDEAGVLSPSEREHLEQRLLKIHQSGVMQAAVVIVPTTGDMSTFNYGMAVAKRWRLGDKDKDNGLVMLIATKDRTNYILVGYGLEGNLPDAALKRILREHVRPAFKKGNYVKGIEVAFDKIESRLEIDPQMLAKMDKTEKEKNLLRRKSRITIIEYLIGGGAMNIMIGWLIYRISAKYLNSTIATVIYLFVGGAMFVYAVYKGWMLGDWLWMILGVPVFGFAFYFGRDYAIEYDKKRDTNEIWDTEDKAEFYDSTSRYDDCPYDDYRYDDDQMYNNPDTKQGHGDGNW